MKIGARSSPLSRAQVEEIKREFEVDFEVVWVETVGDRDRTTSLRGLEKTDFFTRELDFMLLNGQIDAAVHSAKDLPDPMPKGLKIALITEGVDPRDSLVIKNEPVELVATSSQRREDAVKILFPNCRFVDIRGTIGERLEKDVDGVVIAEAALIRLKLTHLKRIFLPGSTTPMQGKLAIVCRENENIISWFRSKAFCSPLSSHSY
ncbi:MAG: hydroxymethylbilane synthase [Chlamydiae bacterium CG10_big_fil_rev_8_21_14_0_10_42_34]|nr:MAG: hydroxymethylbilane synthase [Chlamydiae bacterium CG10_big_fil_rev_8_21_14_0_10_42_34]